MKKLSFVVALLAAFAFSAKAQEFEPGMYLQLQGGAAYDVGEASFGKLISPAAQAAIGYRFNEIFGARISVNGWQARNYTSGSELLYKYRFVQPSLDLQFDLGTLFAGWNPHRVFNTYWFIGGGAPIAFDNEDAIDLYNRGERLSNLWEPTKVFWGARTGLGADIRLSRHVAFNLEVNANMYPDTFNSKKNLESRNPDFRINALAGFTFRFGGKKAPKAAPAVVPIPHQHQEEAREESPRRNTVSEEPVKEDVGPAIYQGADVDIFFDLNQSKIREDQVLTLNRLVSFLRNNPDIRIQLDGYADRGTGTPEINQELSEQRVAAVRQFLVSRGIENARVKTAAHGDTIQPFSGEKNRVVTCRVR